jgi:hypothetical protein
MAEEKMVTLRILQALKASGTDLDDLVSSLPGLTWNQVFLEIDRLSRTGEVQVTSQTPGSYRVALRPPGKPKKSATPAQG